MELEYYREVVTRIRASETDLIINLTTGPGGRFIPSDDDPATAAPGTMLTTPEIRTEHVVELRPEICSLDLNTMWFGNGAVINTPRNIRIMAERICQGAPENRPVRGASKPASGDGLVVSFTHEF